MNVRVLFESFSHRFFYKTSTFQTKYDIYIFDVVNFEYKIVCWLFCICWQTNTKIMIIRNNCVKVNILCLFNSYKYHALSRIFKLYYHDNILPCRGSWKKSVFFRILCEHIYCVVEDVKLYERRTCKPLRRYINAYLERDAFKRATFRAVGKWTPDFSVKNWLDVWVIYKINQLPIASVGNFMILQFWWQVLFQWHANTRFSIKTAHTKSEHIPDKEERDSRRLAFVRLKQITQERAAYNSRWVCRYEHRTTFYTVNNKNLRMVNVCECSLLTVLGISSHARRRLVVLQWHWCTGLVRNPN